MESTDICQSPPYKIFFDGAETGINAELIHLQILYDPSDHSKAYGKLHKIYPPKFKKSIYIYKKSYIINYSIFLTNQKGISL